MSASSLQIDRPQFIPQQPIYSLQLTPSERFRARDYLQLEKLPDLGTSRADDSEFQRTEEMARDYRNRWVEEPSRFELLADPSHCRVCITVSAGTGKSKALEQLVVLRQAFDPNHLVILVHFGQLPNDPNEFLGFLGEQFERLLNDLDDQVAGNLAPVTSTRAFIQSLIRMGKLTLAVDGLDEVNVMEGITKAVALRRFLNRYTGCCCCVAGRPYAIAEFYWCKLFSTQERDDDASSLWEFFLLGSFTNDQIRQYLGEERYRDLLVLQADIDFTPRILEAFRTLPQEVLSRVRSVADVYWYSIDKSLKLDRDKPSSTVDFGITHDEVLDFLSACAITLVLWKHDPMSQGDSNAGRAETGQEPVRHVKGLNKFRKLLFARMQRVYGLDWPVTMKWEALLRLNASHVEFGFFSQPEPDSLAWRNSTDRDFFSALWIVRCSNSDERRWFAQRQSSVVDGEPNATRFPELNEVWRFICGMPSEAFVERDDESSESDRWMETIGTLFLEVVPYRATELMYRSWPNLLLRAGFLRTRWWNEYDLLRATTHAQWYCDVTRSPDQPQGEVRFSAELESKAIRLVQDFLGQYPRLRDSKGEASVICYEDLEGHWCNCESYAGMTARVGHCDEPNNIERDVILPHAYSLCAYPATNRLHRLFDAGHETRFQDYTKFSPDRERGAAAYLNWYDAMMFCIWCHGYSPSEWEWEHGSRAKFQEQDGRNAIWPWGDEETKLKDYAWLKESAITVGTLTPNAFGLYDSLGNVWEWCRNKFGKENFALGARAKEFSAHELVARVMRGGLFNKPGTGLHPSSENWDSRCSHRDFHYPSLAFPVTGCRVSRILHT